MSNIAALLNSPELGGAERSFLTQLSLLNTKGVSVFYPKLGGEDAAPETKAFAELKGFKKLSSFFCDEGFYSLSRSGRSIPSVSQFVGLFEAALGLKKAGVLSHKIIWCNGSKVFVIAFLSALIFGYKGKLVYHHRDYPSGNLLTYLINILERFANFQLIFVGNSESVTDSLKQRFPKATSYRAYNPVDPPDESHREVATPLKGVIGFAGMTAPWKGLHELLLWASLFENELERIGIKEIAVYGGQIYKTRGEHSDYLNELIELQKKFPCSLVKFKGLKNPSEIFKEIDLMLHLSNRKEPFGRVIAEAFTHRVPCLSTALGGASEVFYKRTDMVHFPYDYEGLFKKVEKLYLSSSLREELANEGLVQYKLIQKQAIEDLNLLKTTLFQ